jgi:hypothetical protein
LKVIAASADFKSAAADLIRPAIGFCGAKRLA